jgi:flagellar biosynthesis protein FliR
VLVIMPTPASRPIPATVKVAFALLLAALLQPLVPSSTAGLYGLGSLVMAAMGEIFLGLALGWVGRLVFGAVEMAGRVMANEIGLSAAPGFDAPRPDQEPVATVLVFMAGLFFFLLGGHHQVLAAFARSFELAPAGAGMLGPAAPEVMIQGSAHVIELGLRMSAPFIALNFLVTLAFAVLSKAVPKMNVFILSYPLRLLGGLMMLSGFGMLLARYLYAEFARIPELMLEIVVR